MSAGVAVVLVGLVVAIGAFATSSSGGSAVAETVTGDTGLDPIDPAVMGRTEVAADEVATASDEPASIVDAPAGIVPDVDESAVSSSALESLGAMELQAYATGQASVTSFAVRVRQIGGASIETADLSMTVTTEAGSIPATLEFEQHDLPPGSSAVAIVRLANPLTERADLHLVYDGTTVAEAELASTAG